MGIEIGDVREYRADWIVKEIKQRAQLGFYGHIKISLENGLITHTEFTERKKAPVDMPKPRS